MTVGEVGEAAAVPQTDLGDVGGRVGWPGRVSLGEVVHCLLMPSQMLYSGVPGAAAGRRIGTPSSKDSGAVGVHARLTATRTTVAPVAPGVDVVGMGSPPDWDVVWAGRRTVRLPGVSWLG
ncbi:hypothetical protein AB0K00_40215 [Dactylosporangium sp. NPDC049525]|uniref:hypothetical protein n=1 Tax=Dactylosporangium sp. NPDC049525 TaxID=3154730 RepID=UPI00343E692B